MQEVGENSGDLHDLCSKVLERSTRQTAHRWVAANNFDHSCNTCEQIADFVSPPGSKFSDCGQALSTRHLIAVLAFHLLSAHVQLLNHMVEDRTEVPDLVIAISKTYRYIEVPISKTDDLVPKVRNRKLQIVANIGRG